MSTALTLEMTHEQMPQLSDLLIEKTPTESEHFTIDSPEKAAWAGRRIIDAEDRISKLKERTQIYKAQIDKWYEKAIREDLDSIEYLRYMIRPYVEEEVSHQHKSKTLHLPGISVQLRKKPDRIDVVDTETAISFCEMNHPDAVVVKKEVSKSYLKQLLSKGELIPGCDLIPGTQELYFKDEE
ncbi:MAG: hypothetical protein GW949_05675 [Spirochaetales bacterium]|nr:hypothetical protein [Spirochaetales bacterium]